LHRKLSTGTGSSATDDVSNDDVIDDVSNLASFRYIYPTAVREGFRKRVLQENPLDKCNCAVWFQFSWTQLIIDLKVMPQLTYQNQEIKRLTNLPFIGPNYY